MACQKVSQDYHEIAFKTFVCWSQQLLMRSLRKTTVSYVGCYYESLLASNRVLDLRKLVEKRLATSSDFTFLNYGLYLI